MKSKLYISFHINKVKDRQNMFACLLGKTSKTLIAISVAMLAFIACSPKPAKAKLVKDLVLNNKQISDFAHTYYDRELKKELIYVYDKIIDKKIFLYSGEGQLIRTIPLNRALDTIDNIARITLISLDTIVINSYHTNEILLMNREGCVWKKIDLTYKLNDRKGNTFEFMPCMYPITQNINRLIYNCTWLSNVMDEKSNKIPDDDAGYLIYFYGHFLKSPYFITLSDIVNEHPKINFHTNRFYKHISDSSHVLGEPPMFTVINNAIFINSYYSDKLFKIDASNFKVCQTIQIISDYTKIGTNPIKINKGVIGKIQDSITYKEKTSGRIERLLYSPGKKEYYCIVKHETTPESYDLGHIPFSVITFDTNFMKINEYLFDGYQYAYSSSLITNEGLMLFKNDTTKRLIKNANITFSLFSFN